MSKRFAMPTALPGLAALIAVGIWRLDRESLWVDEVFALASTHDLPFTLQVTKGTMGLYYAGLWIWTRVGDTTWWLRAFSLVGAAATVVVVAAIGRRILDQRATLLAPLLLVGVPIFAWTATEARAYAWETVLVALCWWFIIRGVAAFEAQDPGQSRWWIALGVACAIGPLTHGLFILQIPGMLAVLLAVRPPRRALLRRLGPAVLAAVPLTVAIYLAGGSSMGALWAHSTRDRIDVLRVWLLSPIAWVAGIAGLAFLAGVVIAVRTLRAAVRSSARVNALVPVLWAVSGPAGALVVVAGGGPFAPYYIAASSPGVALVVAGAFRRNPGDGNAKIGTRPAVMAMAATLVVGSLAYGSVREPISHREDWRGAARVVAASARPGDTIVFGMDPGSSFGSDSAALGFAGSWREMAERTDLRVASHDWDLDSPVVRELPSVEPSAVLEAWRQAERVWFVDYHGVSESSGLLSDPAIRNDWCVVESQHFDPDIEVRLYELKARRPGCRHP